MISKEWFQIDLFQLSSWNCSWVTENWHDFSSIFFRVIPVGLWSCLSTKIHGT